MLSTTFSVPHSGHTSRNVSCARTPLAAPLVDRHLRGDRALHEHNRLPFNLLGRGAGGGHRVLCERQLAPVGCGGVAACQPGLVGEDDELGAVARVQLDHRAADVGLRRRAGDHELLTDLLVG